MPVEATLVEACSALAPFLFPSCSVCVCVFWGAWASRLVFFGLRNGGPWAERPGRLPSRWPGATDPLPRGKRGTRITLGWAPSPSRWASKNLICLGKPPFQTCLGGPVGRTLRGPATAHHNGKMLRCMETKRYQRTINAPRDLTNAVSVAGPRRPKRCGTRQPS